MLTRELTCPQCGAPKVHLDDAVVVMCDYCGAFVAVETGHHYRGEGFAELARRSADKLINPTRADARTPGQLKRWVRQSAAAAELWLFDPQIGALSRKYSDGLQRLVGQEDPIAVAREILGDCTILYRPSSWPATPGSSSRSPSGR